MNRYIDKIKAEEGDKAVMYKCTAGKWTIGAGINLEAQEMPQAIRDLWLDMILRDVRDQLNVKLRGHRLGFRMYPTDVQIVLVDMAYQMGVSGLFNFKNMLKAISDFKWNDAADELLDSNYARQTPNRANRNADLLRGIK